MKRVIGIIFVVLFLSATYANNISAQETEPAQINSGQLKTTIITSHMEEAITAGKNLVYCSTFQIAWNMLEDDIIKSKILLTGNPPAASFLNKELSTKGDISGECYVAMADNLTEEFLKRINKALRDKFGDNAPPEVKEAIIQGVPQILAYAYLYKNLAFTSEFESIEAPVIFRSGEATARVKVFGIKECAFDARHQELQRQVSIIDYVNDDNFIISLKSKSANDEIILAKIKPNGTLLNTILSVSEKVGQATPSFLREKDTLQIPKLDFNLKHSFPDLEGRYFMNKGWEDWLIVKATQWIRFKLNEKGAILKSDARVGVGLTAIQRLPSRFVFDKPFLIYLKQKDSQYPYFAMWVDNGELLIKE